jgi:hypothetical protein
MLQWFVSEIIKPLAVPCYCLCAWTLMILFLWSLWKAGREGVSQLKRLHQIPCSNCVFFTGDYRLKCTVHPSKALSEEAINCLDFEPNMANYSVAKICPKMASSHKCE